MITYTSGTFKLVAPISIVLMITGAMEIGLILTVNKQMVWGIMAAKETTSYARGRPYPATLGSEGMRWSEMAEIVETSKVCSSRHVTLTDNRSGGGIRS